MSDFSWIERALTVERFVIPPELSRMIAHKKRRQGAFFFLTQDAGSASTEAINRFSSPHRVIAFARRRDYDGVICVILSDPDFARGQVVELDDDRPRGYPIDVSFPSLDAWTKWAEEDLAYWISKGIDEP